MLLNQVYNLHTQPYGDLGLICGESLGSMLSVPNTISSKNTLDYAYLTFDESVRRSTLCLNDMRYEAIYKYVNYTNTVLHKIDAAKGMDYNKPTIKAQARIIRAYMHWLAVSIYARQYDESYAATEGGIAYVTDINPQSQKNKLTLKESYDRILEDCSDEVISLLPDEANDVIKPSKGMGYAVRAKVLMQMKRYDEALENAEKALSYNSEIEDRSYIKTSRSWDLQRQSPNNYLFVGCDAIVSPVLMVIPKDIVALFEKNDYVWKYCGEAVWDPSMAEMYSGITGVRMCMSFTAQANPYGITTEQLLYQKAECLIRSNRIAEGLKIIDDVRAVKIEKPSSFAAVHKIMPFTEKAAMTVLQKAKVIECLGSNVTFFDKKRWNSEENYKSTVTRDLGEFGKFTLAPESPLWILPFPANAVRFNPSLTQNYK